jgi:FkbM family methyltransferase
MVTMKTFRITLLVLLVAAALGALATVAWWRSASLPEQHAWETRLSLVNMKLQGHLPHVGWSAIVPRLGSRWLTDGPPPLAFIVERGSEPCAALWETGMGRFWGTNRDGRDLDWIVMEQVGWRIYDRGAAKVKAGDIVFDVGAHLGTFTRFALERGAERVVMFEPQAVNAECLRRTFADEMREGRVVLVEAAAWHSSGTLSFADSGPGTMGRIDEQEATVSVPATTFDEAAATLQLPRVDYVKMDIEGAERHALAGGRQMLARSRPRMVVCIYHEPDDTEAIPAVVFAANPAYQMFTRGGFQAYFH